MNTNTTDRTFALGVLTGAFISAGLMLWLAPRAVAEAKRTVAGSANALRERATEQYDQASSQIVAAVNDLASKGYGARDDAADAVVRGAHEVERIAVAVKAIPPRQL